MKVYAAVPHGMSRAMNRVVKALQRHAPDHVSFASRREDAELVVLHVIGYPETEQAIRELRESGQRYAMIQYCMRSTQRPSTNEWRGMWASAEVVWSYYDLRQHIREDGGWDLDFNFYDAPLGVDDEVFQPSDVPSIRNYTMLTSGYVAETEGVYEAAEAVARVGGNHYHLGPAMPLGPFTRCELGISDEQLARVYRSCKYVAGLRRAEGFEMPAIEGLVCGARPVCFDRPHYRRWFEPWAKFVPEGNYQEVTDALARVFREDARVTLAESVAAAEKFNWAAIVDGFWSLASQQQKQEMTA